MYSIDDLIGMIPIVFFIPIIMYIIRKIILLLKFLNNKETNATLELKNQKLRSENTTLDNINKQLEYKHQNDVDMMEFYKNQIQEKKKEFNSRLQLELDKKNLEIEKLKNRLKEL